MYKSNLQKIFNDLLLCRNNVKFKNALKLFKQIKNQEDRVILNDFLANLIPGGFNSSAVDGDGICLSRCTELYPECIFEVSRYSKTKKEFVYIVDFSPDSNVYVKIKSEGDNVSSNKNPGQLAAEMISAAKEKKALDDLAKSDEIELAAKPKILQYIHEIWLPETMKNAEKGFNPAPFPLHIDGYWLPGNSYDNLLHMGKLGRYAIDELKKLGFCTGNHNSSTSIHIDIIK